MPAQQSSHVGVSNQQMRHAPRPDSWPGVLRTGLPSCNSPSSQQGRSPPPVQQEGLERGSHHSHIAGPRLAVQGRAVNHSSQQDVHVNHSCQQDVHSQPLHAQHQPLFPQIYHIQPLHEQLNPQYDPKRSPSRPRQTRQVGGYRSGSNARSSQGQHAVKSPGACFANSPYMPSFLQQQRVQQQRQRRYNLRTKQCASPDVSNNKPQTVPSHPVVSPCPPPHPLVWDQERYGHPIAGSVTHPTIHYPCLPFTSASHARYCQPNPVRGSQPLLQPVVTQNKAARLGHCTHSFNPQLDQLAGARAQSGAAQTYQVQQVLSRSGREQTSIRVEGQVAAQLTVHVPERLCAPMQTDSPSKAQERPSHPQLHAQQFQDWASASQVSMPSQSRLIAIPESHTLSRPSSVYGCISPAPHVRTPQLPFLPPSSQPLPCRPLTPPTEIHPTQSPLAESPQTSHNDIHATLSHIRTSVTDAFPSPHDSNHSDGNHASGLSGACTWAQHPFADSPGVSPFSRAWHPQNQAWGQHSLQPAAHLPGGFSPSSAAGSPGGQPGGWDRGFFCSRQSQQGSKSRGGSPRHGKSSNTWRSSDLWGFMADVSPKFAMARPVGYIPTTPPSLAVSTRYQHSPFSAYLHSPTYYNQHHNQRPSSTPCGAPYSQKHNQQSSNAQHHHDHNQGPSNASYGQAHSNQYPSNTPYGQAYSNQLPRTPQHANLVYSNLNQATSNSGISIQKAALRNAYLEALAINPNEAGVYTFSVCDSTSDQSVLTEGRSRNSSTSTDAGSSSSGGTNSQNCRGGSNSDQIKHTYHHQVPALPGAFPRGASSPSRHSFHDTSRGDTALSVGMQFRTSGGSHALTPPVSPLRPSTSGSTSPAAAAAASCALSGLNTTLTSPRSPRVRSHSVETQGSGNQGSRARSHSYHTPTYSPQVSRFHPTYASPGPRQPLSQPFYTPSGPSSDYTPHSRGLNDAKLSPNAHPSSILIAGGQKSCESQTSSEILTDHCLHLVSVSTAGLTTHSSFPSQRPSMDLNTPLVATQPLDVESLLAMQQCILLKPPPSCKPASATRFKNLPQLGMGTPANGANVGVSQGPVAEGAAYLTLAWEPPSLHELLHQPDSSRSALRSSSRRRDQTQSQPNAPSPTLPAASSTRLGLPPSPVDDTRPRSEYVVPLMNDCRPVQTLSQFLAAAQTSQAVDASLFRSSMLSAQNQQTLVSTCRSSLDQVCTSTPSALHNKLCSGPGSDPDSDPGSDPHSVSAFPPSSSERSGNLSSRPASSRLPRFEQLATQPDNGSSSSSIARRLSLHKHADPCPDPMSSQSSLCGKIHHVPSLESSSNSGNPHPAEASVPALSPFSELSISLPQYNPRPQAGISPVLSHNYSHQVPPQELESHRAGQSNVFQSYSYAHKPVHQQQQRPSRPQPTSRHCRFRLQDSSAVSPATRGPAAQAHPPHRPWSAVPPQQPQQAPVAPRPRAATDAGSSRVSNNRRPHSSTCSPTHSGHLQVAAEAVGSVPATEGPASGECMSRTVGSTDALSDSCPPGDSILGVNPAPGSSRDCGWPSPLPSLTGKAALSEGSRLPPSVTLQSRTVSSRLHLPRIACSPALSALSTSSPTKLSSQFRPSQPLHVNTARTPPSVPSALFVSDTRPSKPVASLESQAVCGSAAASTEAVAENETQSQHTCRNLLSSFTLSGARCSSRPSAHHRNIMELPQDENVPVGHPHSVKRGSEYRNPKLGQVTCLFSPTEACAGATALPGAVLRPAVGLSALSSGRGFHAETGTCVQAARHSRSTAAVGIVNIGAFGTGPAVEVVERHWSFARNRERAIKLHRVLQAAAITYQQAAT